MTLRQLFLEAKAGDPDSLEKLYIQFRPILYKTAKVDGKYDEDRFQDFCVIFLQCVRTFKI